MNFANLPISQDLVDYYRNRIEKSEQDYQDALEALEKIKISHKDYHEVTWELHQRTNEISQLQKALNEAQSFIYDDRKQLLKALSENDELRLQELKDRKKIRYLLAMYGLPDQEETTYFKDELEARFLRRATGNRNSRNSAASLSDDLDDLEYEDAETLRLRCKSLRAQLEEQSKLYEDTIGALKQDKEIVMQEYETRRQVDSKRIEDLLAKLQKLQSFCRENTRELLELKRSHRISDRRSHEERAKLRDEVNNLKSRYGKEKGRNDSMEKTVEQRVSKRNEILINELRQTVARYENMLEEERRKNTDTEAIYKRKLEALQQRLENAVNDVNNISKRRQADIEGYNNEILGLKKESKLLEQELIKTLPLEDREREFLSYAKRTSEIASKLSGAIHNVKGQVYETEKQLQAIPF